MTQNEKQAKTQKTKKSPKTVYTKFLLMKPMCIGLVYASWALI